MSDISDRHRRIARQFTDRVTAVPPSAWDNPAPPEGWVARDVVRHLVEWVPALLVNTVGVELPPGPSVDTDPVGAWRNLSDGVQALLDDPAAAAQEHDMPMGRMSLEQALDMIVTNDVFLHTWDLARATGLDERLDPEEVHQMLVGMEPWDAALRLSGHYGPRVAVPDDADEQSKLIAFIGRRP
jgi:uncharacterized protein (TIGR03086 family)